MNNKKLLNDVSPIWEIFHKVVFLIYLYIISAEKQ